MMDLCDRWCHVIDNARSLNVEYRHKEKEYGIKWRTAFKVELEKSYNEMTAKYGNPLENKKSWDGDQIEVIKAIVEKDFADIQTFAGGNQVDLIMMLQENLEAYEKSTTYLRSLLKEFDLHIRLEAAAQKT